jgi:O-antigen chain-terminating methyltransferase
VNITNNMLDVSDFYRKFEDIHRGSRKLIKDRQAFYLPLIEPLQKYYPESRLIDLGCGRGEWLEVLREIGCSAQGVDQDASMLSACRELNLDVKEEDLLSFMDSLEGESCYAVTGFHIAEHLDFDQLRQLAAEAFRLVKPGGLLILETPNPENILVATSGFYMDPTHTRPIPPHLLAFVAQYAGFDLVEIIRPLASQAEQNSGKISSLLGVLNGVSPDYAILAQKKGPEILKDKILAHLSNFSSLDLPILANQYDQKIEQSLQAVRDQVDALNAQANFTEQSLTAISSQSNDDQMRLVKAETQLKERESLLRTSDQWAQELRATATAALAKVEDLQDQLEEAKDRAKDFEQRAALAGEKITGLELKSVTAETQLKERESLLRTSDQWAQELRATATAALAKVEDLQGQLEEAKDRAKDFEQRAAIAGEKITGLELKSVTAETQLKERESLLRTSDQWAQELRATATAALAKVEDLQGQLEERELLLHASEQSIQELTKNLDIVSQQLLNHQAKLELEQQKNEGLEESIRSLDKDKKYLEEKISEKELLASEQTDEIRRLEITMLEIENQLKTSKEEALALEKAAEALINEIAKDQQHLQQQNIQLENLERNHKENAQLLMEAENKIATLEAKLVESQQTLYDKEQTISEQQATQARQNREAQELNQWAQELHELVLKHPAEINGYKTEIKSLKKTLSWRLTWPLRGMKRVIMFVIKQIARVPYLIGRLIHGLLVRPVLAILLWPLHKIAPLKRLVKGLVEQHPKLKRFAMKVIGRQIIAKMPVHGHEARPDEVQEQNPLLANLTPRARSIYAQLSALSEPPELQNTQGSSAYEKVEYAGELQVISSPQRMKTGEIIWIDVSVENKSATNWSAEGMHPIRLTYRWIDENENFVESEPQRTAIVTGSIKPNETFRTHLLIQAPFLAGKWTLLPTLVQEGVCWFDQQQEFENQRVTVTVGEAN